MRKWMRILGRGIVLLLLVVCAINVASLALSIPGVLYGFREEKHQARLITSGLQDKGVTAYWSPGWGEVTIYVYGVVEEAEQQKVKDWIVGLKANGEVDSTVQLHFYEKEEWREISPNTYQEVKKLLVQCELK